MELRGKIKTSLRIKREQVNAGVAGIVCVQKNSQETEIASRDGKLCVRSAAV